VQVQTAMKLAAITAAQATLATAKMRQKSLEIAEQRLLDTQLRAPEPPGWKAFASVLGVGVAPPRYSIAGRMISEGEMVRNPPGNPVLRLVNAQTLKLRVSVPEKFSAEVLIGQLVELRVEAQPAAVFTGRVVRLSPAVDVTTRTFAVEAEVPNADGRLMPGMFARAAIITGTAKVLTLPQGALSVFAGLTKVFVEGNGKVRATPVEVGTRTNEWVEVRGELAAGARVLTSGFSQAYDGAAVQVK